ncbi:MAG: RidA family protein [Actinobacteria bacterium]|nr:RidA family protein [Actinomycetota bacterium]
MPGSAKRIIWAEGASEEATPLMADAVRWDDLLFLSGRAAVEPGTLRPRQGGFEAQALAVFEDIGSVLEAGGSGFDHVVRIECFLADARDFDAWNRIFRERFPASPPARTTVVTGFAVEGLLIELQVIAGVPA